ncbi:hypothetical protein Q5P01_001027 [Channa striata]|uniref:Uncharacterized protein n=1 Tax=Channa striata TaxID=64152 RepID=A0AA88ILF8_CHASR|nr:hypothetical protein Q5P01_001027 [Channa striata]
MVTTHTAMTMLNTAMAHSMLCSLCSPWISGLYSSSMQPATTDMNSSTLITMRQANTVRVLLLAPRLRSRPSWRLLVAAKKLSTMLTTMARQPRVIRAMPGVNVRQTALACPARRATADPLVPCLLSAKYRMLLGMYAAKGRPRYDELARRRETGVPSGTFNTMKLEPAAEVRTRRRARQVGRDHRWYAAAGHHQDPGLDRWFQETRAPQHDMHGSVREILRDLNDNPAPRPLAARARGQPERARVQGIAVDAQCKDVFNGKKSADAGRARVSRDTDSTAGPASEPHLRRLKVAGVPHSRPIRDGGGGRYTHHNGCARGCRCCAGRRRLYTEVDLVAHDMVTNTAALLELKTRNNDALDDATLWRYNTQLWLT